METKAEEKNAMKSIGALKQYVVERWERQLLDCAGKAQRRRRFCST
jgi:hypothetical protein